MKVLTDSKFPVKMWTDGVPVEADAKKQLLMAANMPFIFKHIAVMPDVHVGSGSTVGCVIPSINAVAPATVGVDIGCGMIAARSDLKREQFVGYEEKLFNLIHAAVPTGRSDNGGRNDTGSWQGTIPNAVQVAWGGMLFEEFEKLIANEPRINHPRPLGQLGTLGTGNHFIELSEDEEGFVWIALHSGSRGPGNRIGSVYTSIAKELCAKWFIELPQAELAFLPRDTAEFYWYCEAVKWAQRYAMINRKLMLNTVKEVIAGLFSHPTWTKEINCHHNYISWERHFGQNIMVVRKGAVKASEGTLGFIPGSMGARSFVVEGLGNRESFTSCSHGAGRVMSRTAARAAISKEQHAEATRGVTCCKDERVIDESPSAYKDIDAVMAAQADLVRPIHTLKQFVCVKGLGER